MVFPISPGLYPVKPIPPGVTPTAPPAQPVKPSGDRQAGNGLQRDYAILLQNYRLSTGFAGNHFPLEAFSLHQDKILLTYQDRNGARKQAFLTEELLQRLFHQRGVPYERGAARRFLGSLRTLLENGRLTPWEQAMRKLTREGKGEAAAYFRALLPRTVVFDGHLVAQDLQDPGASVPLAGDLAQEITERFGLTPAQCRGIIQNLKQALAQNPEPDQGLTLSSLRSFHLLYGNGEETRAVRWDKKARSLEGLTRPVTYRHTQKVLPLEGKVSLEDQGEGFLAGLQAITGGDPDTADRLAELLAVMAAPTAREPQLSVLYTKGNTQAVKDFLTQIFAGKVITGTISKLLRAEGRKRLLAAQVKGTVAVLLEPTLPTPSQMGDFVTLVQGGRLAVKDKLVPSQAFRNQMHLVYVTDSETLTEVLLKQYQARLVDLSAKEQPWQGRLVLSPAEETWLRRCFLLHGSQQGHGASGRRTAETDGIQLPDAELHAFLTQWCRVSPEMCCSRGELYQAYCQYYASLHGTQPPETATLFGKRLRKQALEGVEYKVKRYGPDKGTQLCYVGLGILDQPRLPAQGDPGAEGSGFRAYLAGMEGLAEDLLG